MRTPLIGLNGAFVFKTIFDEGCKYAVLRCMPMRNKPSNTL